MKQVLYVLLLFVNISYSQTFISYYAPTNQNFIFDKNKELIGYCDYDYLEERNDLFNTSDQLIFSINNNKQKERFEIHNSKSELLGYTTYNDQNESIEFYTSENTLLGHIKLNNVSDKPIFQIFDYNGKSFSYCALIGDTNLDSSKDFSSAILLCFVNLLSNYY